MNRDHYAAYTAIGLLNHFDRIPSNEEAEEWLQQYGGFEKAKRKAVQGRCRAALALLNPPVCDLESMRSDDKYQQFTLP
jgi:hypothetical protein